jgi:nicotinamidase-related amidase
MSEEAPREVFGSQYFRLDPDDCALLVVDMQNGFVAPGAAYEVEAGREILPNIDRLVVDARGRGIPVFWTQSDHSPPAGGLILERQPIILATGVLCRGHESFELYPPMTQPVEGDLRIVKHKYDAFHGTDLDMLLRNLRKGTVLITGVTTECCCESTARTAFFNDYKVVFVSDGNANFDPASHKQACDRIDLLFGRTLSTDEILDIFERGGEAEAAAQAAGIGA